MLNKSKEAKSMLFGVGSVVRHHADEAPVNSHDLLYPRLSADGEPGSATVHNRRLASFETTASLNFTDCRRLTQLMKPPRTSPPFSGSFSRL